MRLSLFSEYKKLNSYSTISAIHVERYGDNKCFAEKSIVLTREHVGPCLKGMDQEGDDY